MRFSDDLGQSQNLRRGIPEDDDLDGARVGLKPGYGPARVNGFRETALQSGTVRLDILSECRCVNATSMN